MNAQSGVNHFLGKYASFDYQSHWKFWLDFKSVHVDIPGINNASGANPLYSGYHLTSPSGFVSDDYFSVVSGESSGCQLLPSSGLWADDFSLIFLNKKRSVGKSIIFNCLETGLYNNQNVYKGYRLGYTDSNKPFFEYYTDEGLQSFVGDFNLNTYHSLNFVKTSSSISIGTYDFLGQKNESQSFPIKSEFMIEPDNYYLGHKSSDIPIEYFAVGQTRSGEYLIDEFLYFDRPLYNYDIQIINSGFVANYTQPITGSGVLTSTGVTGSYTGLVSIFSGITGYGVTGTGYITNEMGVQYTGFLTGALTADISGSGVIDLTGIILTPDYFLGNGSVMVASGYLKEFYNSGVCFISNVDNQDIIELVLETGGVDSIALSQVGLFDTVKQQFRIFDSNPSCVFLNGQSVVSGQLTNSGSIYSPVYVLSDDYYNTGSYIDSLGNYAQNDFLITQNVGQTVNLNYKNFSYSGGTAQTFTGVMTSNSLVFFNGQKLNSGEYQASGNDLIFSDSLYDGVSGRLLVLDVSGSFQTNSGNFGNITVSQNNPFYSMIFLNGQKLTNGIDYLTISNFSLLNSSGIFKNAKTLVYDDTYSQDNFWK